MFLLWKFDDCFVLQFVVPATSSARVLSNASHKFTEDYRQGHLVAAAIREFTVFAILFRFRRDLVRAKPDSVERFVPGLDYLCNSGVVAISALRFTV